MTTAAAPRFAYFGHHKCATRWIVAILRDIASAAHLTCVEYHNAKMFDFKLKTTLERMPVDFLFYTNAAYGHAAGILETAQGFHVVRDPRDVCVSSYFSHLHSHATEHWPELAAHRKRLQAISRHEGLLLEMEFRRQQFLDMATWEYSHPNCMEVRFEDLTANDCERFMEIFEFLDIIGENPHTVEVDVTAMHTGLGACLRLLRKKYFSTPAGPAHIPAARLLEIVYNNRFSQKTGGRRKGAEDTHHHYRKGISGDWRNYFEPEHIAFFKAHYNELLLKLGYEQDPDWDRQVTPLQNP